MFWATLNHYIFRKFKVALSPLNDFKNFSLNCVNFYSKNVILANILCFTN